MWERAGLTRNDPGDQRRDEREESADAGKRWMQARGGREGENMKIIRVAGGVGSGKSQVLSILKEEYNAHVILADEVAKRLMEPGQPVFCQVVEALGEQILGADGTIDRPRMAQIIFSDREALRRSMPSPTRRSGRPSWPRPGGSGGGACGGGGRGDGGGGAGHLR